jgi:hypothetical protein
MGYAERFALAKRIRRSEASKIGSEIFSVVCFIILKGLKSLALWETYCHAKNAGVTPSFLIPYP